MAQQSIVSTVLIATLLAACKGAGTGSFVGTAEIPVCSLTGSYQMTPTFFQSYRTGPMLTVRVSEGGGELDYTDHYMITFRDTEMVNAMIRSSTLRDANGVAYAEIPVGTEFSNALVSARFAPNWSCGRHRSTRLGQAVSLWSYAGTIQVRSIDRGSAATSDAERYTDVPSFTIRFHDPRPLGEVYALAPPGLDPTAPVGPPGTEFTGFFEFHHSRMPPAQVFPYP